MLKYRRQTPDMTMNENIKAFRLMNRMTQSDLARKAGPRCKSLTAKAVGAIETGARVPTPDEAKALADALDVNRYDLSDPNVLPKYSEEEPGLFELAQTFRQACGLKAMEALSALETQRISNNADLSDPNATRYVPPILHDGRTRDWKKDERNMRFLAGFHALFRPDKKAKTTLPEALDSREFRQAVSEAAMLQDVRQWDDGERAMLASIASLYTAYIMAEATVGGPAKCTDIERKINLAMSNGKKNP